jgi:hypothetical protein
MKIYIGRYISDRAFKKNPNAKQKVDIRIDRWDTWNMAETLADIILPMLIQLRNTKHGSPSDMRHFYETTNYQYPQLCFDFYKKDDKRADELGHKEWTEIMDKMIWSFEQITDRDRDAKFHTGNIDIVWTPTQNGASVMGRGPNDTHQFDIKGFTEYNEKIQEGLDLFGKYYRNLWD